MIQKLEMITDIENYSGRMSEINLVCLCSTEFDISALSGKKLALLVKIGNFGQERSTLTNNVKFDQL